jgi:hypothetical protein
VAAVPGLLYLRLADLAAVQRRGGFAGPGLALARAETVAAVPASMVGPVSEPYVQVSGVIISPGFPATSSPAAKAQEKSGKSLAHVF